MTLPLFSLFEMKQNTTEYENFQRNKPAEIFLGETKKETVLVSFLKSSERGIRTLDTTGMNRML